MRVCNGVMWIRSEWEAGEGKVEVMESAERLTYSFGRRQLASSNDGARTGLISTCLSDDLIAGGMVRKWQSVDE